MFSYKDVVYFFLIFFKIQHAKEDCINEKIFFNQDINFDISDGKLERVYNKNWDYFSQTNSSKTNYYNLIKPNNTVSRFYLSRKNNRWHLPSLMYPELQVVSDGISVSNQKTNKTKEKSWIDFKWYKKNTSDEKESPIKNLMSNLTCVADEKYSGGEKKIESTILWTALSASIIIVLVIIITTIVCERKRRNNKKLPPRLPSLDDLEGASFKSKKRDSKLSKRRYDIETNDCYKDKQAKTVANSLKTSNKNIGEIKTKGNKSINDFGIEKDNNNKPIDNNNTDNNKSFDNKRYSNNDNKYINRSAFDSAKKSNVKITNKIRKQVATLDVLLENDREANNNLYSDKGEMPNESEKNIDNSAKINAVRTNKNFKNKINKTKKSVPIKNLSDPLKGEKNKTKKFSENGIKTETKNERDNNSGNLITDKSVEMEESDYVNNEEIFSKEKKQKVGENCNVKVPQTPDYLTLHDNEENISSSVFNNENVKFKYNNNNNINNNINNLKSNQSFCQESSNSIIPTANLKTNIKPKPIKLLSNVKLNNVTNVKQNNATSVKFNNSTDLKLNNAANKNSNNKKYKNNNKGGSVYSKEGVEADKNSRHRTMDNGVESYIEDDDKRRVADVKEELIESGRDDNIYENELSDYSNLSEIPTKNPNERKQQISNCLDERIYGNWNV